MTEIAEMFDPTIVSDVDHEEDTCFFCQSQDEPKEEENELEDDKDEDADSLQSAGIKFKNDSGKLTKALTGGEGPDPKTVSLGGQSLEVGVAAHHLIPGNASLKKSTLFKSEKYLWTDGKKKGNIGYNVNSSPNGVFLPGNYAQRPWGGGGATFKSSTQIEPKDYAFAGIEKWNAQFHDAHPDYSKKVKDALNKLYDKLELGEELWCPEGKKQEDDPEKRSPLYVIVARLNTVSARMKRMLINPSKKTWKRDVFTSRFSLQYIEEKVFT